VSLKKLLRIGIILLGLALVFLLAWPFLNKHPHQHSSRALIPIEGLGAVEAFEFINQEGEKFGSKNLKGQSWVANFIFTRCAGPCPIMSTRMARLQNEFKDKKDLKFVSFSVDPDYDKPEILKEYAQRYAAEKGRWIFLTGPLKKTHELIRKSFHLAVDEPVQTGGEQKMEILHSLHFVLVNPKGEVKGYFNSSDPIALADLKEHLKNIP